MDGADSTIYLEQQVGDRFARKDISNHELRYDIISRLLQPITRKAFVTIECFPYIHSCSNMKDFIGYLRNVFFTYAYGLYVNNALGYWHYNMISVVPEFSEGLYT